MTYALLLVAPLLWVVLFLGDRARRRQLAAQVGRRLEALVRGGSSGRWIRALSLFSLGLFVLTIVMAASREGTRAPPREARYSGIDLMVCLDVSRSMLAEDVLPSRLRRAQQEVLALAGRAQGDRLGLVVFAGDARLQVPLTQDVLSFASLLAAAHPDDVGRGGTDLGAALALALEALPKDAKRYAAILLFSDGEDLAGRGLTVAATAAERGIPIYCVGLGSPQGSKITLESDGGTRYLRDQSGEDVLSVLDLRGLREIAARTGGEAARLVGAATPAVDFYEGRILSASRETRFGDSDPHGGLPLQLPLLFVFLCWGLAVALGEGRR
jgi:Ca-activated chloride channel family protein